MGKLETRSEVRVDVNRFYQPRQAKRMLAIAKMILKVYPLIENRYHVGENDSPETTRVLFRESYPSRRLIVLSLLDI